MFKSILLPIDLNDQSSWDKALSVALAQCKTSGGKLHLITVLPDFGVSLVGSFFPAGYETKAREATKQKLQSFMREHVPSEYAGHVLISDGTVYEEILKTIRAVDADLVVMAAHRPDLKDFLLGPNAARVVRHAKVSVMVVR